MEEKIIAVAAGREITEAEFNAFVARVPQEQQQFVQTPEGRHQALTQYANYFLFEKMGEEKGYDKTAEFLEILEGTKRELLSQYALTQLVKDVTASEEECKAYYEEHQELFQQGAQARAKHFLTPSEEEALRILNDILAGKVTFEDAAKENSSCPSGAKGGDLGTFGRGQMVKEFDEAVFNGKVGEVMGPVQTSFGYHLIRVDELSEEGTAPFEVVAEQIRQHLVAEKQNELYMAARAELIEKYGLEFK